MMTSTPQVEKVFNPRKFIIFLLIISSLMAIAGLVSAYIVMRFDETYGWKSIELPSSFKISTLIVLVSSVTMQLSYGYAKKKELKASKLLVVLTFILGVAFTYLQFKGFGELVDGGHFFAGRMSTVESTFIYIFALVHMLHLFVTMIVLIVLLIKSFQEKVYNRNIITFHNSAVFWHFLGVLWVFLYLFLYFSH